MLHKMGYYDMNPVYIGIIGSRTRDSEGDFIKTEIAFCRLVARITGKGSDDLYEEICIVSGTINQRKEWEDKGGDKFARIIAAKYCFPILIFPPNYSLNGKEVYLFRNRLIARKSDYLIACVDENSKTSGTKYTIGWFNNPDRMIII